MAAEARPAALDACTPGSNLAELPQPAGVRGALSAVRPSPTSGDPAVVTLCYRQILVFQALGLASPVRTRWAHSAERGRGAPERPRRGCAVSSWVSRTRGFWFP